MDTFLAWLALRLLEVPIDFVIGHNQGRVSDWWRRARAARAERAAIKARLRTYYATRPRAFEASLVHSTSPDMAIVGIAAIALIAAALLSNVGGELWAFAIMTVLLTAGWVLLVLFLVRNAITVIWIVRVGLA